MENENKILNVSEKKHVSMKEMLIFLIGTFLMTTITGVVNGYRQAYLVDVLVLDPGHIATINAICSVLGFVLSLVITIIVDRTPKPGKPKFKNLVKFWSIPFGITSVLLFYTPDPILKNAFLSIAYLVSIQMIYNLASGLAGHLNSIAVVISPNNKERDDIISYRGIVNAIGNSAPLVVLLVAGAITDDEGLQYLGTSILCSVVGVIFMLLGAKMAQERVTYSSEKQNPLLGFKDIIKNKYALIVVLSEFLKAFRKIASYMGVFLAAALLGSKSKYILFSLPTGIGTFVGMMIVKILLNKFNSKQIYIASGIYSLIANTVAFGIGYLYFTTGATYLQIIFVITLFLIGLQFGASNLLPSLFQADILEDLEVKTHKRLDASLGFICGLGSTVSSSIASTLAPLILLATSSISIIGYVQPEEGVYPEQSMETKLWLLFFYTVVHGIMMFLGGLPFFLYKLTGKTKQEVHEAALAYRLSIENEKKEAAEVSASAAEEAEAIIESEV